MVGITTLAHVQVGKSEIGYLYSFQSTYIILFIGKSRMEIVLSSKNRDAGLELRSQLFHSADRPVRSSYIYNNTSNNISLQKAQNYSLANRVLQNLTMYYLQYYTITMIIACLIVLSLVLSIYSVYLRKATSSGNSNATQNIGLVGATLLTKWKLNFSKGIS